MSKKQKIILGVLAAVLAVLCAWTVLTVPDRETEAPPLEKRVMTYNGNRIAEEKDGRLLWELTAETMEVDVDTQDASMTNLDANFYTEDGRKVHVTAKKANYIAKDKLLTAEGEIKGDSSDGIHLKADKLEWNAKENTLAIIDNTELKRDSDAVLATGDRMETYDGFNKFKIIGHAHLEKGKKNAEEK